MKTSNRKPIVALPIGVVIQHPMRHGYDLEQCLLFTYDGQIVRFVKDFPTHALTQAEAAQYLGVWFGCACSKGEASVIRSERHDLLQMEQAWVTSIDHPKLDKRILISPLGTSLHELQSGEFIRTLMDGELALELCEWITEA